MSDKPKKVGIISCSGEAIPGGTISRVACRKVLEDLRPRQASPYASPSSSPEGRRSGCSPTSSPP